MKTTQNGLPRVVVTGLGALTPLGTLDAFWQNLKEGNSGIRRITHFDPQDLGVQIAGEVDFEPREHIDPKTARRMARASQMALIATRMARDDASLIQQSDAGVGDRIGNCPIWKRKESSNHPVWSDNRSSSLNWRDKGAL